MTLTAPQTAKVAELDALIAGLDGARAAARAADDLLNLPWEVFIRMQRLETPQAYGTTIQKYLTRFYDWARVPASADRGDVVDRGPLDPTGCAQLAAGRYYEIKVTLITPRNTNTNFVQIRPYQSIDGYRLFVVDRDYQLWRFDLTKAQMANELALVGSNAHGTKVAANDNINREYAVRFEWSDADATWRRWTARYLSWARVPGGTARVVAPEDAAVHALATAPSSTYPPSQAQELPRLRTS